MKMLKLVLVILLGLLPWLSPAQTEVAQYKKLESATILEFPEPYRQMIIYLEDDEDNRHTTITIVDTTLFVKKAAFGKRKKNIKPADLMQASDFRPGMKINLWVNYYQISQRNEAERISLDESYYGPTSLVGIYEKLDGNRASIDGQAVILQLDKGKHIDGLDEWKGKKFTSFADMQLGAEVKVYGERKPDGVIYASRGTMRPVEMSKEDYLLRRATDNELRVTRGFLSIADAWQFRLIANNQLEAYISTVGRRLIPDYLKALPVDHPDHVAFKFFLVNEGSFNASSYPNGAVVVHTGLLTKIENEAQLAAILGHEIAHVTQKHHAQQFRNHQNWEAVKAFGAAVAAGTDDKTPLEVTRVAAEMSVSTFSQKQETQADRIGLHYMINAGYDPRQAVAIWRKLAEEAKEEQQKGQQKNALNWIQKSYKGTASGTVETRKLSAHKTAPAPAPAPQPLFPSHPRPRDRYTHVNFLISTTYVQLNMTQMNTGDSKFRSMIAMLSKPGGSIRQAGPAPKPKKKS
ncbi:hypothetical protein EQG79_17490 [Spirosoma sordidisoli]|uniref:Peptidase M48 domain-containing protein n=2 Tax=Spirosoma sordidisoli TaxID=2502893 RepID=A0A4Q2UNM1_9BACT|nr:hypothetical protein EQG79_17490 [Spirosoma sordidisoli]